MLLYGVRTNLSVKLGANTFSLFPSPDHPTELCFFPCFFFSPTCFLLRLFSLWKVFIIKPLIMQAPTSEEERSAAVMN